MNIKVISTNIRFENPSDNENNWPNRKQLWANTIQKKQPDFICTQEGRYDQLMDAENTLTSFSHSFKKRQWIKERMYPCIFINSNWIVLASGDKWLSETPDQPGSSSFGSMFPRLMTYSIVKNKADNKKLIIVNCHLDHIKASTRSEQSKVLVNEIKKINLEHLPIILTGDFNESPNESVRKNIDSKNILPIDPWKILNKPEEGTHHQFTGDNRKTFRIDWILGSNHFTPIEAEILKDHDQNIYPSDHFPIYSNFLLD